MSERLSKSGVKNEAVIELPASLTAENIFHFARVIDGLNGVDRLVVDMGQTRHFSPFALVFIATKIKSFKAYNSEARLILRNYQHHQYLGHMGFFYMCGAEYGRQVGASDGNANHIPITVIARQDFYESPTDRFSELPDLIQRHVDRIAKIISRDVEAHRELEDVVSFSFREVFRNVFEHSGADELHYCAQYWPASGKLEVAVADQGIGIRRGLGLNPNFRFDNDKDALEASLLPGVSGRTHLPRTSETWFNSGYGLYMTNRLARHGGNFAIASGTKAIVLTAKTKSNFDTSFSGTCLRLNFDVRKIGDVSARLGEFREDAKTISKMIQGAGNRPPSAMSLLLRRDFKS